MADRSRIVMLTGGVRSGKSRRALELALPQSPKIFLATAAPSDDEMRARIARHRAERDERWRTIEEPLHLAPLLREHVHGVIVIDCMTLWLANALEAGIDSEPATTEILAAARDRAGMTIMVTNEVGWGIVPAYQSGRRFRDLTGAMNQQIARVADEVVLMISGLPLSLKGALVD